MLSRSYLVHHLQQEIERLSDYYRHDPMRALAHWAIRQIDPKLTDAAAFEVVRLGGTHDCGIDGIWPHSDGRTLCVVQIKGSEKLIRQNPIEVDADGEDIEVDSFPRIAVDELRAGLDRLGSAPPVHPSDRLAGAMAEYAGAVSLHKEVRLYPIVFGDRSVAFDRAVDEFRAYLASNRDRMPKHWVEPLDLVALGDLLDRNFETPPAAMQIAASGWLLEPVEAAEGVIIALVPAATLAQIRSDEELRIYHSNFRYQLRQSPVREGMWATLRDDEERKLFHLYHNGITVLGTDIAFEDRQLRLRGMQVVNGLQTIETLYEFSRQPGGESALANVHVLTRFIDTSRFPAAGPTGRPLDERIAEYSNKQNPITSRDLRSNDSIQKRLQHEIDALGFKYQRKRGQYTHGIRGVVDNLEAAQYVLSFWEGLPAEAKANAKMLFVKSTDDARGYYDRVFPENVPSGAILVPWLIEGSWREPRTGLEREVLANGRTILLAMMGSIFEARYRVTLSNASRKSLELSALVAKLRTGELQNPLEQMWPILIHRLSALVKSELRERTRVATEQRKKPPTVRNVLVGFRYSKHKAKLLPRSVMASLCTRLPQVG